MRRRTKQKVALFGAATVAVLMWPGPAGADTSLGGYSGLAQAQPIRIQIYEPTIPIPSTPQVDGGIGFTRTSTDTGPVSRALASYLWPGDTVGDGFSALVGNDKAKYPIQVNSRNPATADSPAKNTAQLTDGNGMTTSSDGTATKATVTGLGVTGTNVLSDPGKGLGQLLGHKSSAKTPALPVPVSTRFAALASVENVKSQSSVTVGKNSITSFAHASASEIRLLSGLITIEGFDVTSQTVSDGKKATTTGRSTIGAVSVAGKTLGLTDKGITLGGSSTTLPKLPEALSDTLDKLGIRVETLRSERKVDAATGSLKAIGLAVTVDTALVKRALGTLTGPLADLVGKIPKLGSQLQSLLGLGPKIVLHFGDVESSATASPAFTGGSIPAGTAGGSGGGGAGGGTNGTSGGGGSGGGGTTGGTDAGAPGADPGGGSAAAPDGTTTTPVATAAGYHLPALGAVPRFLVLTALAIALGLGWLLRAGGAFLLGGRGDCAFGLASGVPDLRTTDPRSG